MEISSIDWNTMWKESRGNSPWGGLSRKELWDKRAANFNKRIERVSTDAEKLDKDDYISKMLNKIETSPEYTVLDIGCGPGTLAIPLAKKVKSVTALDISGEMLKHLKNNAEKNGLSNIKYVNCSWDEAVLSDIGVHDIVVASRSLTPVDIKETISKVSSVAREAVYLTFPVVHLPLDWEAYQAIGRGEKKHPSYIYIYNTLYQMGIHTNIEILYSRIKVRFSSVEEAMDDLQWRTTPFTDEEKEKLVEFLRGKFAEQKDSPFFSHEGHSKWVLIWWKVRENALFEN
jgi:SAM-dependent methyltransferase